MMDSPRSIGCVGLNVSIARLTADQRGHGWFWCAAFKVNSTAPELGETTLVFFFQQKKNQFC